MHIGYDSGKLEKKTTGHGEMLYELTVLAVVCDILSAVFGRDRIAFTTCILSFL